MNFPTIKTFFFVGPWTVFFLTQLNTVIFRDYIFCLIVSRCNYLENPAFGTRFSPHFDKLKPETNRKLSSIYFEIPLK